MKFIVKQSEPNEFSSWKTSGNNNWQPCYADLRGNIKDAVKVALIAEQGTICCYCERRLIDDDSHIEHFEPQSKSGVDALDFSNLLCSCQKKTKRGEPLHCGNRKGDWFNEALLVSPLDSHCDNRFSYKGDGTITATEKNDNAANETISRLGLGIPKLNALRKKAIEPFLDDDLSYDDLKLFVSDYLKKDQQNELGEFWTTINSLFGTIAV
ncbi:TIGR02646 family protein [Methylococcaceae bacterium CS1]|nr:TIGR02646 family protein [Methylococcaceae bacterium CS4]TXL04806.1 TIGR02646 family protein [Methylococcaceae bacterium CS1]